MNMYGSASVSVHVYNSSHTDQYNYNWKIAFWDVLYLSGSTLFLVVFWGGGGDPKQNNTYTHIGVQPNCIDFKPSYNRAEVK